MSILEGGVRLRTMTMRYRYDNDNDDDGDNDSDDDDDSGLVLASSQLSLLSATPETASPVTQSIGFQPKHQSIIRNLL